MKAKMKKGHSVPFFISLLISINIHASEYSSTLNEYNSYADEYSPPLIIPLPPPLPDKQLIVDISSYTMKVLVDNSLITTHNVIVGRPGRETPTMDTQFKRIIINPTWIVPQSLIYKLVEKVNNHKDPVKYMADMKFRVFKGETEVSPSTIDWKNLPKQGPYNFTIRQDPGPNNFVGRVLFSLQDTGSIQMHDTPDKELFKSPKREFSAGCIRVENAINLAAFLSEIPKEEIEKMINEGKTLTLTLPKSVKVHIVD